MGTVTNRQEIRARDRVVWAAMAVLVGAIAWFSWSDAFYARIGAWVEVVSRIVDAAPIEAGLIFFAGCVVATAVCFPVKPLLGISAGFLFGFWWGLGVLLAAATIGSTLAFLASRYWLRERAEHWIGPRLAQMRAGFERHEAAYLLTVRFNPFIPYWLVNLLAGLTDMRLRSYVPLTAIGLLPASLVYVTLGSQLETLDDASGPSLMLILAMVVLSLAALVPVVLRGRAKAG